MPSLSSVTDQDLETATTRSQDTTAQLWWNSNIITWPSQSTNSMLSSESEYFSLFMIDDIVLRFLWLWQILFKIKQNIYIYTHTHNMYTHTNWKCTQSYLGTYWHCPSLLPMDFSSLCIQSRWSLPSSHHHLTNTRCCSTSPLSQ